MATAFFPYPEV